MSVTPRRKGERRLFGPDDDPSSTAILSGEFDPTPWDLYAEGYRRAGAATIDRALADSDKDALVFPAVFLYRHYVELRLKQILLAAGELLDHDESLVTNHEILKLWLRCRPKLEEIWKDEPRDELEDVQAIIAELDALDRGSCSFRYPVNRKGARSLPSDLGQIGLRRFRSEMDKVAALLEGVSGAIDEYIQYNRDADADSRR